MYFIQLGISGVFQVATGMAQAQQIISSTSLLQICLQWIGIAVLMAAAEEAIES